jgi:excisionase family DNA binding protein
MTNTCSVKQFAEMANVSPQTVYRWIYGGTVKTIQIVPGSPHRIPRSEFNRLLGFEPMTETPPAPEA